MKKAIALSLLLWGCAAPEEAPSPDVYPPAVDPGKEVRKERSRQRPQEAIKGLTLEKAFQLAEGAHPGLAAARARAEAAQGRVVQAGLFPNPILVGRMESAPFEGGTTGEAEYVAGVSQRIPVGGRLGAATRAREFERDRLLEEFEVERLEIRGRVHAAFAAALYMEEVVKVQTQARTIAENGVAVAKSLLAAGDALPEEVARVEIEELRARLEVERARSMREVAFLVLVTAIGEPRLKLESTEGALDAALEIPTLESVLSDLAKSPFAGASEADIAASLEQVDLARAERIPDVNIDLFYRRLQATEMNAFDLGLGIAIPLFDRNQGRLSEARADLKAAKARARASRNELERRVREAYLKLSRAMAHSRLLKDEILPRAETVLKGAETRYSGGDIGLVEALPIRRERTALQLAYLESLREVMEAWASLKPFIRSR